MTGSEPRSSAKVAGWSYLVIIVCGLFAEFGVRQPLGLGSPDVQFSQIENALPLFKASIACDLVMLVADVIVAWALWQFFARVHREASALAAMFRLVQAAVIAAGVALAMQATNADWARLGVGAHADAYRVGLVFFGACCLVTAWLSWKSGEVPKWIAVLISLAGAGYLFDTFGRLLIPGYSGDWSNIVLLPAFVGEIAFCVWLIGWGGKKAA